MSDPTPGRSELSIQRVEKALRTFHADYRAAPDWQARVLDKIRADKERPGRRMRLWPMALALTFATVLVMMLWPRQRHDLMAPVLALQVESAGPGRARGLSIRVGDKVQISAAYGAPQRGIWIYRGERELIVACPGAASCEVAPDQSIVGFRPLLVGRYTVVALWASEPIFRPQTSLDDALAQAIRAGAVTRTEQFIVD